MASFKQTSEHLIVTHLGITESIRIKDGVPQWDDLVWTGADLVAIMSDYMGSTPDQLPLSPDPDWEGFLKPFHSPAFADTTPFHIIETAVQVAWLQAVTDTEKHAAMSLRTYWNNCIAGLTNPTVRSREWLVGSWNYLLSLLTQNGVALTEEQRQGIESLMRSHYLL